MNFIILKSKNEYQSTRKNNLSVQKKKKEIISLGSQLIWREKDINTLVSCDTHVKMVPLNFKLSSFLKEISIDCPLFIKKKREFFKNPK